MDTTDWLTVLSAYLHDPPDKAIDIRGHFARARRYAKVATDDHVTESDLKPHADPLASAIERLPMPPGEDDQTWVSLNEPGTGSLQPIHPLSGELHDPLPMLPLNEVVVENEIRQIVAGLPGSATEPHRFLALWRLLRVRLAKLNSAYALLPADTRVPDHTLTQHNDITAALAATGWGENTAFLSFSVGPVQGFIASARTVRDLWTGSMILSWLVFRAMVPILERLGPTAFVYPALRGVPLVDLWLQQRPRRGGDRRFDAPELEHDDLSRKSPCLPNRFVAVVPWGTDGVEAIELADKVRESARDGWNELCQKVHDKFGEKLVDKVDAELRQSWDALWSKQVDHYFDFRTAVLPWKECDHKTLSTLLRDTDDFEKAFPAAHAVRGLAAAIPNGYPNQLHHGQWQHRLELSARLLEAAKGVRPVPPGWSGPEESHSPPKCSLLGSYEQMGPAGLADSNRFWERAAGISLDGVRLSSRERFSAIALGGTGVRPSG
ncbi:MAG: hypothetical protein NT069_09780 [Planctomycetota bacterium]|nr:hypothetical protein [Planctomycetota bacterium]